MKARTLNYLKGIGSLLDIMPRTPIPALPRFNGNPMDAIGGDWMRVGADFSRAIGIAEDRHPELKRLKQEARDQQPQPK